MKVLYFSRSLSVHDRHFLIALVENGHQAYLLRLEKTSAMDALGPLPEGVREPAAPGTPLSAVLAGVKPDLLHAGPLHTAGAEAARSGFHPLVLMSWGSDILYTAKKDADARAQVSEALEAADALIADCQAVHDAALEFGFPAERIQVFPWGVDLQRFSPGDENDLRAQPGWEDAFVLLHLRAWEPLYGVETVARAFVLAAKQEPRLRLLLPGDGSQTEMLRSLFEEADLLDRVYLPGRVSQADLPRYYHAADLYLSASRSDGSSVSLMEALACGLPALVSDIPGNREWVQPDIEGWLFPVDDVEALTAAILEAAAAPADLRQSLGANARRTAEARADWRTNQQGLFAAYELAQGRHA